MEKMFCISVVTMVGLMALAMGVCPDQGPAQMMREPSIEGVSYAEIAQWQSIYGRGPFLRGAYGPGYCVQPQYEVEYCETDESPAPRKTKKHQIRSSTK